MKPQLKILKKLDNIIDEIQEIANTWDNGLNESERDLLEDSLINILKVIHRYD